MIAVSPASPYPLFTAFDRLLTNRRISNNCVIWFLCILLMGCASQSMLNGGTMRMLPSEATTTPQHVPESLAESGAWGIHFFTRSVLKAENLIPPVCCVCFPLTEQEMYSIIGSPDFLLKTMKIPYSCISHQYSYLVRPTLSSESDWYVHHHWGRGIDHRYSTLPYSYYCSTESSDNPINNTEIQAKVALWRQYATIGIKPWVKDKHLNWFFNQIKKGRDAIHDVHGAWYSVDDSQTKCYLGLLRQIIEHPALILTLHDLPHFPWYFCFVPRKEVLMYKKALHSVIRSYLPQEYGGFFNDLVEIILKYLPIDEPLHFIELQYARKAEKLRQKYVLPHCPLSLGLAMYSVPEPLSIGLVSVHNQANLASINRIVCDAGLLITEFEDLLPKPYHYRFASNCSANFFMQLSSDLLTEVKNTLRLQRAGNSTGVQGTPIVASQLKQFVLEPNALRALCLAFCANTHDIFTYFEATDYFNQYEANALTRDADSKIDALYPPFDSFDFKYLFEKAWYPCASPCFEDNFPFPVQVQTDEDDKKIKQLESFAYSFYKLTFVPQ